MFGDHCDATRLNSLNHVGQPIQFVISIDIFGVGCAADVRSQFRSIAPHLEDLVECDALGKAGDSRRDGCGPSQIVASEADSERRIDD